MGNPSDSTPVVRVLIADHDPLVRRVVRDALRSPGITVVAEAVDGSEVVELALRLQPDVVLMDLLLPEVDGVTAIRRVVAGAPLTRVIVFTGRQDDDAGILGLKAGASGYVTKDVDLDALPRIVRAVSDGETAISRTFASVLLDRLRAAPEGNVGLRPVRSPLTAREWEVMDLLSSGFSMDEIAAKLVLSPETVNSHLKRAMRKLDVHSRRAAIEAVAQLRTRAGIADAGAPATIRIVA